jgi:CDP-4-dehydro-6-deoxyglucose reductase
MAHQVKFVDSGDLFDVQADETVLEAALRHGVSLAHECTLGGCGTCRVRIEQGSVTYRAFPTGLTEQEHAEGYALTCQAQALEDLTLAASRRLPPCSPVSRQTAVVRSLDRLASDVTHLRLEVSEQAGLLFRAGQYVNICLPDGAKRSFSMASKPHERQIDFHVRHIAGGRFTGDLLHRLKPGDTLALELPLGTFCYHEEDFRPLLILATGTGIAPIKSMLETLLDDENCPPVTLYWGARTRQDLYLHEEISSWSKRQTDFRYVPVLSRADANWDGGRGYVQDVAVRDMGEAIPEQAIYICGSPVMIADAKSLLLAHHASVHHIYTEGFTQQPGAPINLRTF